MCTLQEWKETDLPASTAGSLTEILTGDPLHPVSEEQLALSLGANKSRFAPLFTFFLCFQLVLTRRPRLVLELLLNSSL